MGPKKKENLINRSVDLFWSGVDWMTGVHRRVGQSRRESQERREPDKPEAPPESREQPPPSAEPAPSEKPAAAPKPETAREAKKGASPEQEKSEKRDGWRKLFPSMEEIRRRRAEARRRRLEKRKIVCPSCQHVNLPPAVFCDRCHEALIHISKFLILMLVTLAIGSFLWAEKMHDDFEWPYPLYGFYALVFLLINMILVRKARRLSATVFFWSVLWLTGGFIVFWLGLKSAGDALLSTVETFGAFLLDTPVGMIIFFSGLTLAVLILFVWMARNYTFAHAYRIIFICEAAAAFAGPYVYARLMDVPSIASALSFLPDEGEMKEILYFMGVNSLRVLAAEMIVFSMVRSYRPAMEAYEQKKIKPKPKKTGVERSPLDQFADSAYGFSIILANAAARFLLQIEHGFLLLMRLLRELGAHLGHFLWTLTRDLVLPIVSLTLAVTAIYHLAVANGEYIAQEGYAALVRATLAVAVLFAAQIAFLTSKSRIPIGRLLSSHLLLLLWFSPYMLTLFIFVSVSLFAIAKVLMRVDRDAALGFKLGPMTLGALVLTVVVVVYAVIRRHREGGAESDGAGKP